MQATTPVPFTPTVLSQPLHAAYVTTQHPAYLPVQNRNVTLHLASTQSLHQKRASDVLTEFDALRASCTEPVWLFILHYACCDALARLLIGSREAIPPHKVFSGKGPKVDLRKVKSAQRRLRLRVSHRTLNLIFQTADRSRGHRSCRVLRNGLLHGLHAADRVEIVRRRKRLVTEMARFIEAVRFVAQRGHNF